MASPRAPTQSEPSLSQKSARTKSFPFPSWQGWRLILSPATRQRPAPSEPTQTLPSGVSANDVTCRASKPSCVPKCRSVPSRKTTRMPSALVPDQTRPVESVNRTTPFVAGASCRRETRRGRSRSRPSPSVPTHTTPFDSASAHSTFRPGRRGSATAFVAGGGTSGRLGGK